MKANLILAVLVIAAVAGALWFMTKSEEQAVVMNDSEIRSFADCAAVYPVMESFPRQCKTSDGRTFTEELPPPDPTYVNASADNIRVSTPTPGSVTGKPITVMGEARGGWYFEASFPVEVRDNAGNVISTGIAQAQGEWMTENFVPFIATVQVPTNYIGEAVLVLMNDNPSGMPENARSVSFPITIEY